MEISKTFSFEASHMLSRHPGKCSRLHGHSWKMTVAVEGEVNLETGFVMDYAELKGLVQPLVDALDHRHLGEWYTGGHIVIDPKWDLDWAVKNLPLDFYPSSENLLVWIGTQLARPIGHDAKGNFLGYFAGTLNWSRLELEETCTSKAVLTRKEYDKIAIRNRRKDLATQYEGTEEKPLVEEGV